MLLPISPALFLTWFKLGSAGNTAMKWALYLYSLEH